MMGVAMSIVLDLNCGLDSCAKAKGEFCQFFISSFTGYSPRCALFNEQLFDSEGDVRGWILRCQQCKEARRKWDQRRLYL
jgi:hypothetical protein